MKKIFYILLFCLPLYISAQTYKIEYDVNLNVLQRKGYLIVNQNKDSYYYETSSKETADTKKNNEDGYKQTVFLGNEKDTRRYQLYPQKKDSLISIDYLNDNKVLCTEAFPLMQWVMDNDTKKISNYTCNKAHTFFRGRKYTAWFTMELPLSFGPWKFNNLPGAILQVYDEANLFSWNASKISFNVKPEAIGDLSGMRKISLEYFVKEDEKSKREKSNQMVLKYAGRGAEVTESKFNRGRETIFEWEK